MNDPAVVVVGALCVVSTALIAILAVYSSASRLRTKILGLGETTVGNPDFDRAFRIRTSEPAALRRWFTPPLIAAHLNGQVPPAWSVDDAELLCHQPGRLNPDDVPRHAAMVLPLADLLDSPRRN